MRGRVLGFDDEKGAIVTADGARFNFDIGNWRDERGPARGLAVDFVERAGVADEIYLSLEPEIVETAPIREAAPSSDMEWRATAPVAEFEPPTLGDGSYDRPPEIARFEYSAYAALALSVLFSFAALGSISLYPPAFILIFVALHAFWAWAIFATARLGSNTAKWLYVGFVLLGIILEVIALTAGPGSIFYTTQSRGIREWLPELIILGLQVDTLFSVFSKEAGDWFYWKHNSPEG